VVGVGAGEGLRALGLFEGVGSISRAADQIGYSDHVLVEKEQYQRRVLAKRFPSAEIYDDVSTLDFTSMRGSVDLLHGGSPCQGFSVAGIGAALQDHRSRLIFEMIRAIRESQPRVVLIENVSVLRSRGLSVIVDALARIDYLCWWDCVPALAVGAPHLRDRVWITAVHSDEMPDLDGRCFNEATTKLPRAGALTPQRGLIEMAPAATVKAAKEAMGAVRQPDGTTWLTTLGSPLFPTSSVVSYGSNSGGATVQLVLPRHGLESMARHRMWPTPSATLGPNGGLITPRKAREGGTLIEAVSNAFFPNKSSRLWPTAGARDYKDMALGDGAIGRGQLPEAVRDSLRGLDASDDGQEVMPREDCVGPLSPNWVEWLMGMPIGWTDHETENEDLVQLDWSSEHGLPRVDQAARYRKDRLICCGNACLAQIARLRILQAHEYLGIGT
jgi:site-specific DNA-cytosine methylase